MTTALPISVFLDSVRIAFLLRIISTSTYFPVDMYRNITFNMRGAAPNIFPLHEFTMMASRIVGREGCSSSGRFDTSQAQRRNLLTRGLNSAWVEGSGVPNLITFTNGIGEWTATPVGPHPPRIAENRSWRVSYPLSRKPTGSTVHTVV